MMQIYGLLFMALYPYNFIVPTLVPLFFCTEIEGHIVLIHIVHVQPADSNCT